MRISEKITINFLLCLALLPARLLPAQQAIFRAQNVPPISGGTPWTLNNTPTVTSGVASGGTVSLGVTTGAGDSVIVSYANFIVANTVSSMTAVGGTCTFSLNAGSNTTNATLGDIEVWDGIGCGAGVTGIIVNIAGTGIGGYVLPYAVSHLVARDGAAVAANTGSPVTGAAITPSVSGDFIVATFNPVGSTLSLVAGNFTNDASFAGGAGWAHSTTNSLPASTQAPTWTCTGGIDESNIAGYHI